MAEAKRRTALIARREWAGYTHESLAELLGASVSAVSSWERGLKTPIARFRQPLAKALGLTLVELDRMLGLEPAAYHYDGHLVQKWLSHYESLIVAAGSLITVSLLYVPHLLQTMAYATVIEQSLPGATDEQVSERVAAKLQRQRDVFDRASGSEARPLRLEAFVEESVLASRYGGGDVMTEQRDHLIEMAHRPNVMLRLLPADGRAAYIASEFELLTKPDDVSPFIAYTADAGGPNYHEGRRMGPFVEMYEHVTATALAPGETIRVINDLKDSHRRR